MKIICDIFKLGRYITVYKGPVAENILVSIHDYHVQNVIVLERCHSLIASDLSSHFLYCLTLSIYLKINTYFTGLFYSRCRQTRTLWWILKTRHRAQTCPRSMYLLSKKDSSSCARRVSKASNGSGWCHVY